MTVSKRQHYNGHTGKPKQPHPTERGAHIQAQIMKKKFKGDYNVYLCEVCGKWHVGNAEYIPHQDHTLERIINWFKRVFR